MNLSRVEMLAAVEAVKPALATKDLIEELAHVWFDGKTALAYNDADLGIQVPFHTPFEGGIRGSLLLGLLHASRAKEVSLEPEGEGIMLMKAARTRAKLAMLEIERAPWQFPAPKPKSAIKITEALLAALKAVLIAVGDDTTVPEKMGVTFDSAQGFLQLFTTDSKSIAAAAVPEIKIAKAMKCILPTEFCKQVVRSIGEGGFLEIRKDCAIAGDPEGLLIYGRIIESARPLPFAAQLEKHAKFAKGAKFEIPSRLALALDRALVLLEGMPGEPINLTLEGGRLKLSATVEGRGELRDSVPVDGVGDLVAGCRIEPGLLKRALDLTTHMVVQEESVWMSDQENFIYLASTAA